MMNIYLLNRSGLAAIAAATALLATPALAQDAVPVVTDPAPIVADTPLPSEPTPAEPTPATEAATDTLAPAATTTPPVRNARPARATVAPAARIASTRAAVANPVAAAPVAPVADVVPAIDPAMVAPLPEPVVSTPVAAADTTSIDDMLPIAGAAGLGILALAGAGFAMRRRRREDDVTVDDGFREPVTNRAEPMPVATPPVAVATNNPAFNWGNAQRETAPSMSRIEAARRGPTPDNPSQSLKKRLQRAAFFDQRERAVAAGKALPMSPMAGLPDALAKPLVTRTKPVGSPAPSAGIPVARTFQPA
ncbi:MAG: hypothetical protein LH485_08770 [Sphingomonas bacterium]|nr:hypothetical protein [Sphingomonas bacterium]